MLENYLINKTLKLHKKNIKFKTIGDKSSFSKSLIKEIQKSEKKTKSNKALQLNLALNYGSKSELINTMKILKKKKLNFSEINIKKNLYTSDSPDPDILIRTGNTNRLSNFLLWQLAYAEIFFVKKLWPDFTAKDYNKILKKFVNIKRNFGNI